MDYKYKIHIHIHYYNCTYRHTYITVLTSKNMNGMVVNGIYDLGVKQNKNKINFHIELLQNFIRCFFLSYSFIIFE